MREVSCYSCKSDNYFEWGAENGFKMVKCTNCGLLYVNPVPDEEEIDLAVKTGMHKGETVLNVVNSFSDQKINDYLEKLPLIYDKNSFGSTFSWLDIGCGYGEFIIALKSFAGGSGIYKGIEPNEIKKNFAVSKGLDVDFTDIKNFPDDHFDFVSMLNVYSHLPDPGIFFKEIRRILKKDGEILIQTGDAADLNRQDFPHTLYLPDHLSFASENIIRRLLENSGYSGISVRRFHNPGYPVMPAGLKIKKQLFEILRSIKRSDHKKRNYFINTDRDMWIRARKV
ncbi:MAG TPA: class I SAM-dependent methyltransferase [Ignavibacteria bacterium]|nr:class I SAM-dependent methyltransferase [Ignavibacteria bacterium]HRJ98433.1 class I SAM-dependent methyltransferase [Ignavibacteria bacterium]